MIEAAVALVLAVIALCVTAYALSLFDIFFTQVKEGTVKAVMKGESFDHFLMHFKGHYLNDPRRGWYVNSPDKPDWEVLDGEPKSAYAGWQLHWKLLERFGVYWFGMWPFYKVLEYRFEWTEPKEDESGTQVPWHRSEPTRIIYVSAFVYWLKILTAEDSDGLPVDIHYLLTVKINNPYKARFGVTNWLARISADTNNAGKVWAGKHSIGQMNKEVSDVGGTATSGFVEIMKNLNINLPTEHSDIGAQQSLGVTVLATSLQQVDPAGSTAQEIREATTAKTVASMKADAVREAAKGSADAVRTAADAEKYRIQETYAEIAKHGELGALVQQLDAIKESSKGPGNTTVWANNPLIPLTERFLKKTTEKESS